MELRIDKKKVGAVTVKSSDWAVYTINAYVAAGTREVAIAFVNDYKDWKGDRNLYVDKITITQADSNSSTNDSTTQSSGTTSSIDSSASTDGNYALKLEAENMPTKTTGGSTSGGWNIWANGYIADKENFPVTGSYKFEIIAKGSYAGGAWPIMELRIDKKKVGAVTVKSSDWAVYTINAYVAAGTREVAIAFVNDYKDWKGDRNLYVDKVIINK
jgi:hypothetical protein